MARRLADRRRGRSAPRSSASPEKVAIAPLRRLPVRGSHDPSIWRSPKLVVTSALQAGTFIRVVWLLQSQPRAPERN